MFYYIVSWSVVLYYFAGTLDQTASKELETAKSASPAFVWAFYAASLQAARREETL